MLRNRLTFGLSLLLAATLGVTACAPRTGGGTTATAGADAALLVDLPAIVIDFDAEGKASLAGVPVADLNPSLAALDTAIGPDTVAMFTEDNIQHLQISTTPAGIDILVNGQAIPSLAWDGESLATAQQLLAVMEDESLAMVQSLLPQIANVGIGVTMRFPPSQGAELIPLSVTGEGSAADAAAAAQEAYLDQAGSPARINVPITYAADGTFSVGNLTAEQLTVLAGAPIEGLTLTPDRIARYQGWGIKTFGIATDSDGVHLTLNGTPLPHISWGDGKLAYGLTLALQTGLVGSSDSGDLSALIEKLLPIIQTSEVNILVTFPE